MRRTVFFASIAALGAAGCLGSTGPDRFCTTELRFGVNVRVESGDPGTPLPDGVTGVIVDGDYRETLAGGRSLENPQVFNLSGAPERAGTYSVTVSAPGFLTLAFDDVTVTRDECHVIPVVLRASLIPERS